ncbi:hypothetical protein R1L57_28885, partial [Klebsiella sp. 95068]
QTETEATGAPQKHHYTLNQQVGSITGLQTWLLRSAGAVAQPASAIYVAIFNAAIGTGAFVGGQLIASAGLSGMVWLAAGIMVGSTLLIALLKAPLPGQIGAATAGA